MFKSVCCLIVCVILALSTSAAMATARVEHVFVVSIDGGNPEVMQRTRMPVLNRLMKQGAYTFDAKTIMPPFTLPAHTSMLTGVGTNQHKITWSNYVPTNGEVGVPTVFSVAKAAGFSTAMFVGKEKFRHLLQSGVVDEFSFDQGASTVVTEDDAGGVHKKQEGNAFARTVAKQAADYIVRNRPNLCFIHFSDPDTVGHERGWGSVEQLKAFADTDKALGILLKAIRQARIDKESVIIISADYGGHGRGHSQGTPADLRIPWIAWGKGVKQRFAIVDPVNTCDTAATVFWLLGLQPAMPIDGVEVKSAFK